MRVLLVEDEPYMGRRYANVKIVLAHAGGSAPALASRVAVRSRHQGSELTPEAMIDEIDELEVQIAQLTVQLNRQGADHRYVPVLVTAPGIGWINA